jgi:thiol-disulfide isomerase/thioredoxin
MSGFCLGPLAFPAETAAVLAGMISFMVFEHALVKRFDGRLEKWMGQTILAAVLGARLVHVALHWDVFATEPLRALAVWQGGSWIGAAIGVAVATALAAKRTWKALPLAACATAAFFVAWVTVVLIAPHEPFPPPPAVVLYDLKGSPFAMSDRARPAVLNLWATWCPPCRRELPMMAELAKSTSDADFIFANQGESREAIRTYLQDAGLTLDIALVDTASILSRHYSAIGTPTTLFLNSDGSVSSANIGEITKEMLLGQLRALKLQNRKSAE